MKQTYLPGTVRERIQDLMKQSKFTQATLAEKTGCAKSTLSRFISGKTDKFSDEKKKRSLRWLALTQLSNLRQRTATQAFFKCSNL